jgi:hypothetical protein
MYLGVVEKDGTEEGKLAPLFHSTQLSIFHFLINSAGGLEKASRVSTTLYDTIEPSNSRLHRCRKSLFFLAVVFDFLSPRAPSLHSSFFPSSRQSSASERDAIDRS